MGRLFWKFFAIFWLAQVVTFVGVGFAIWLEHPERGPRPDRFDGGPPPPPPLEFSARERPHPPPDGPPPPRMPLVPILAGSLVSLLFAAVLAWYFARPIRSLRAAFEAVAGGHLETRVSAAMGRRNDELVDLGADFDRMAERLQKLIEAQRRLLHDVSHELRSPLARLQAAADLMRQQPERSQEFVARIERDTARMDALVGELLTLARLDAGMNSGAAQDVDLCEVVADIVDAARIETDAKRCTLAVDCDGQLLLRASHELLYRAIENVVRNAVRHSPAGGVVTVSLRVLDDELAVVVTDQGAGVFDSDLGAIFEPFFRSGPGRSGAGYGLGLAITRRVVESLGGRVTASNGASCGLVVTLILPLTTGR